MHVRPIRQSDLYDFSRVVGLAMWNDEVMNFTSPYKDHYPDSFYRYCLHRAKVRYYSGEELYLAVTDKQDSDWTGKEQVIGYCAYSHNLPDLPKTYPGGWLGNFFEKKALELSGTYAQTLRLNRSADPAAERFFRNAVNWNTWHVYYDALPEEVRKRVDGQHFELELLGTHPDFRRRGVGNMMLQVGFEKARQHQVPLFLIASIAGEKLYLNAGFKEVARIDMDVVSRDSKYSGIRGGKGLSWATMVWETEGFRGEEDKVDR